MNDTPVKSRPPAGGDTMKVIARIHTDFPGKFGIPRQSGIVEELRGKIVFEPEYRNPDALRGLEGFSHIWLIWKFSQAVKETWSPMVRPPRLGGSTKMGVFATRSPFRPNAIGLSSVKLLGIQLDPTLGPVLLVSGADLMDGTPLYDLKPYLAYTDSHPEATGGFTSSHAYQTLEVTIPQTALDLIPEDQREALRGVLANDPRPHYHEDPSRIYSFEFGTCNISFSVEGTCLTVCGVKSL